MILDQRFQIKQPNVIHETIDNEVVIVNLESGNYYSLENVGADIWDLIKLETALDEIVGAITRRYEGDQTYIENGIDHFISELQAEELIASDGPHEPAAKTNTYPSTESGTGIKKIPFTAPVLNKYTDMKDLLLLDPIHEVDEQGWPHIIPEQTGENQ